MKKSMLLCLLILFSITLSAQDKKEINVSEKVKAVLIKLYPDAKDVKWTKNLDITNASFIQEGKRVGVTFKADTLLATMFETEIAAIPKVVKNHLDKYYKNYSIMRAGKIHFVSIPDEKNVCYGADITDGSLTKRVICYPNGEEMSVSILPDRKKN